LKHQPLPKWLTDARWTGFNFDLKPSNSDTYEAGLKSQNLLGDFTLAVFQTKTKDDIVSAGSLMDVQLSVMQIKPYVKVLNFME
jgi:outer membrane receptor protein involved in Fe transport